ncbi:MAG TPA: hypothetical protein VD794_13550 [Flavisolibacter sp.]|nr:hypothetical protein [Flavisolibacter sp.]
MLASSLFFACKKEKEKDPITISCNKRTNKLEEVKQLIAGRYEWAYTNERGRVREATHTPASTGSTHRYVFDKGGTVKYYENDQLIWERSYEVDYDLRITSYPLDSNAVVIIRDKATQVRQDYFWAYLCNDSALFYHPRPRGDIFLFRKYQRDRL